MPQTSLISWLKVSPKFNTDDEHSSVEPSTSKWDSALCSAGLPQNNVVANGATHKVPTVQLFKDGPPLIANASIEICTQEFLSSLKRLNSTLFPIPYQDKFYKEIVEDAVTSSITRIALWKLSDEPLASVPNSTQLVGAIRCRLIAAPPYISEDQPPTLYIATLGVLAPFRRHGLASLLLSEAIRTAATEYGVYTTVAHVWEKHEDSLEWYKRRGFQVVEQDEGYYKRLAPHTSAWVVRRDVKASDYSLGHG